MVFKLFGPLPLRRGKRTKNSHLVDAANRRLPDNNGLLNDRSSSMLPADKNTFELEAETLSHDAAPHRPLAASVA